MLNADDKPEPEWFDMEAFRKSGDYIGPARSASDTPRLAELDIDRIPSPSGYIFTEVNCQLAVRDWGLVIISEKGLSLRGRTLLPPGEVEAYGPPWK